MVLSHKIVITYCFFTYSLDLTDYNEIADIIEFVFIGKCTDQQLKWNKILKKVYILQFFLILSIQIGVNSLIIHKMKNIWANSLPS